MHRRVVDVPEALTDVRIEVSALAGQHRRVVAQL
jgi:hypothetical protein